MAFKNLVILNSCDGLDDIKKCAAQTDCKK